MVTIIRWHKVLFNDCVTAPRTRTGFSSSLRTRTDLRNVASLEDLRQLYPGFDVIRRVLGDFL